MLNSAAVRLERNLDLDVAASRYRTNGRSDLIGMPPNERPLGATRQHDEGDAAGSQVLLVANAMVGRQMSDCGRRAGPTAAFSTSQRLT